MRSRLPVVVGATFVVALFTLVVVFPEVADSSTWYAVGGVYGLTVVFGAVAWYWRTQPLDFRDTVGIAVVVVVLLVPLTPRLFVEWGSSTASLGQYWSVVFPLHLQRFVPIAFMFPLGAATTRHQQLGTVALILLPTMYELFDWFVLHPEQFDPHWTTPLTLVVSSGFWVLVLAALGSLLVLLGCRLSRHNGTYQQRARHHETAETR